MTAPAALPHPPWACPACRERLTITRLSCPACATDVSGAFATCRYCSLGEEERDLLELFLVSRGNLKEVERALGVSYPTARARVDALIGRLDLDTTERSRVALLEALARGDIAVDDALARLDEAR
jgi:hypothetical protein